MDIKALILKGWDMAKSAPGACAIGAAIGWAVCNFGII